MEKKKVEFEFDPVSLGVKVIAFLGGVGTIIALLIYGHAASSWIDDAEESHQRADSAPPPPYYAALEEEQDETNNTLDLLKENQLQLQQQEILRQELWGPNYRKKISEILDENNNETTTGSE